MHTYISFNENDTMMSKLSLQIGIMLQHVRRHTVFLFISFFFVVILFLYI